MSVFALYKAMAAQRIPIEWAEKQDFWFIFDLLCECAAGAGGAKKKKLTHRQIAGFVVPG